MSDFLDIALWIFDLLVKELLPLLSLLMAVIFIYKISKASQITMSKLSQDISKMFKRRG